MHQARIQEALSEPPSMAAWRLSAVITFPLPTYQLFPRRAIFHFTTCSLTSPSTRRHTPRNDQGTDALPHGGHRQRRPNHGAETQQLGVQVERRQGSRRDHHLLAGMRREQHGRRGTKCCTPTPGASQPAPEKAWDISQVHEFSRARPCMLLSDNAPNTWLHGLVLLYRISEEDSSSSRTPAQHSGGEARKRITKTQVPPAQKTAYPSVPAL